MKKTVLLSVLIIAFASVFAQRNNTLLTIGDKKISDDEFKYIYLKNNTKELGKKTPEEYLDLFVNFKLFVTEAEHLKMDTAKQFINELQGYKDQLADPFLTQAVTYEKLLNEAYLNSKTDVKFNLIFIKVDNRADEKQKAVARAKVEKIRSRIIAGEDFKKVARETSDQRGAAQNGGEYPFVQLSILPYSLQKFFKKSGTGTLSSAMETQQGYYIAELVGKRPNPGNITAAHIMVGLPPNANEEVTKQKKQKADSIWKRLEAGDNYEELAKKHSDDKNSGRTGGQLAPFTSGKMVTPFEDAVLKLNTPGEYSKPVKTRFGFHIIKLIKKEPIGSFEDEKINLKRNITRDPERNKILREETVRKLKNKYNLVSYKNKSNVLLKMLDSSIYKAKWDYTPTSELSKTIIKYKDRKASFKDFADFLKTNQRRQQPVNLSKYYDEQFEKFIYQNLTEYEKERLEEDNETYSNIIREYKDGMLLFEYKKKYIWNKAMEDSVALEEFFNKNKKLFGSKEIVEMKIYKYQKDKTARKIDRYSEKELANMSANKIKRKLVKKTDLTLSETGVFSRGDNATVDKILEMKKQNKLMGDVVHLKNAKELVVINKIKSVAPKSFKEIKGLVISEYQNELEKKQLEILRKKYPVKVNEGILKRLKFEL